MSQAKVIAPVGSGRKGSSLKTPHDSSGKKDRSAPGPLPASIYGYVWKINRRGQLIICLFSAILIPLGTVPLDLQRRMVDTAPGNKDLDLLIRFGALYLGAILAQQGLKYGLNIARGWVVEDVTRRQRRIIHGRKDSLGSAQPGAPPDPGTAVAMAASEAEDIAGFNQAHQPLGQ